MILFSIFAMTSIVFLSRYLFLEPAIPLRLNHRAQRLLSYSSSAVLTAIWGPIVFLPEGELNTGLDNPYFIAAIIATLIAWKTKNILITATLSMTIFMLLKTMI